jgi:1,4-alpha-glucan branching enzyme
MVKQLPLIEQDPWLEPYEDAIRNRLNRYAAAHGEIEQLSGTLVRHADAHLRLGVLHDHERDVWTVREWAPDARGIWLIGDFNAWDRTSHPLERGDEGIWELVLPGNALAHEQRVKLHIHGADDARRDRIPACIRRVIQDPQTHDFSGQIWDPQTPYVWRHTLELSSIGAPLIYEAHVGMSGEEERVHTYREFAEDVLPRIAKLGYQVIQLMAVQEHPYYGSFGYHVSSFFAPASRSGTPEELKHLIDTAHGMGIAVLLDIVQSHAVKNMAEGLNNFDGSEAQYFHRGGRGEHPQWDSKCFDYHRPEVRRFLLSNVRYWLEEFRFDGFRFDGVTSMLYHHHGTTAFDHYDKYFRHDIDDDAILYLQLATTLAKELKPKCLIIAEDMSGMPGLCRPVEEGGVGFTHRLAMGIPDFWIKLLKHTADEDWNLDELWGVLANRRYGEPTIAYAESHDQALVGDKTVAFWLMDKEMYWHMQRDDKHPVIERGIALHKMIRLITMAVGGEGYLNFMGNEFGHPEWLDFPREGNGWSYKYCRRQWSLVDNPDLKYRFLGDFDAAMVHLAAKHNLLATPPAQLLNMDAANKIICAERGGLIFVFNFSIERSIADYRFYAPKTGKFQVVLDSDAPEFGGFGRIDHEVVHQPQKTAEGHHEFSVYAPARTVLVLAPV